MQRTLRVKVESIQIGTCQRLVSGTLNSHLDWRNILVYIDFEIDKQTFFRFTPIQFVQCVFWTSHFFACLNLRCLVHVQAVH